ncbi:endonuclease domain-containing protein [Streptomyces microflavus]|uniref:endonuclease domain-containing protein n=1 Tax=Streptomyces microflavus TaxID=1919 RepID=UPI00225A3273|nr:endonuclease domain-containing protein [Streptomyces microflavus]MCX4657442.1 endonuclease VII domain-containing protein [Streptomyces microflavus]
MLISREYARTIFADLSQNAMVPLDPDELVRTPGLIRHGHVLFGDVAVRCYKHKGRWRYAERDIRSAGQTLSELRLDLEDMAVVELPAYRDGGGRGPEEWSRVNWRGRLVSWMFDHARNKAFQERHQHPDEDWTNSYQRIGENGLPGGLSWDEFVGASAGHMGGTRLLKLLTWSGNEWLLPRAYIELLDRWEQREDELVDLARTCSTCGLRGPYWGGWRTSTSQGYVTRCPPCSGAVFRSYTGHLRGVQYASARRRATRPDDYLCRLCKKRQATVWDHCHEHGYVRAPLCGSCNNRECKSMPHDFLQMDGALRHLLECVGCLDQRTLPPRFRLDVVRAHLEETERHGRCRKQPYADLEQQHADGGGQFQMTCRWHSSSRWTKDVTAAEAAALVGAYIEAALAAGEARPSPGAAPGVR